MILLFRQMITELTVTVWRGRCLYLKEMVCMPPWWKSGQYDYFGFILFEHPFGRTLSAQLSFLKCKINHMTVLWIYIQIVYNRLKFERVLMFAVVVSFFFNQLFQNDRKTEHCHRLPLILCMTNNKKNNPLNQNIFTKAHWSPLGMMDHGVIPSLHSIIFFHHNRSVFPKHFFSEDP